MRRKARKQRIKSLCDNILTEAARALRAIFLNIVGDTKTEIEEGVTWTTGEIAGLRDVIKLYAKDAYDAAQASGEVIDPMRAIAGLAQSVKDGVLSEAKLTEMVSDIGGKLRTSQLLAIVNNWDMYENMLQTYRNAYGSADKEIENAMDSWTRKTNVLKNTWTEFVKTGLNSNAIKVALDILTGFIQRLDSLPAVLTRITMLVVGLRATKIVDRLQKAKDKVVDLFAAVKNGAMTAQSAAGIVGIALAAIAAAWSAISVAVEDNKKKTDEAIRARKKLTDESKQSISTNLELIKSYDELRKEYEAIIDSTATEAEKEDELKTFKDKLIEAYGFEEEAIEKVNLKRRTGLDLIDAETQKEVERALALGAAGYNSAKNTLKRLNVQGSRLGEGFFDIDTARAYEEIISRYTSDYELSTRGKWGQANGADEGSIFLTGDIESRIETLTNIINGLEKKIRLTGAEKSVLSLASDELHRLVSAVDEAQPVINEYNELLARNELAQRGFGKAIIENKDDLANYKDWLTKTYDGDEDILKIMLRLVDEAYPDFSDAVKFSSGVTGEATKATEDNTKALFANQEALDENASATDRAAAAKKDAEAAVHRFIDALFDENGELTSNAAAAMTASSYLADLAQAELDARTEAANANYAALRAELAAVSKAALQAASSILAMEAAYDAGENSGIDMRLYRRYSSVSGATRAAEIMRQISALESQINNLSVASTAVGHYSSAGRKASSSSSGGSGSSGRSGGSSSSSSESAEDKKLKALQDRVKLLKSELSLMQERGDSEKDQIAKMRQILSALHDEQAYLESINGDQATINNLLQEWYSYANKIAEMTEKTEEEYQQRVKLLKSELSLMQERGDDADDQIAKMREIMDVLRQEYEYLESINGDQVAINNLYQEWYSYANQISDLEKQTADEAQRQADAIQAALDAQKALDNILKKRSVRVYNASTGQWEWQADPAAVASAQSELNNAISSAGYTQDGWATLYSMLSGVASVKDNWLNSGPGAVSNAFGGNSYGNTYNFGRISLSEAQAQSMTVAEFARLANALPAFNNSP